LEKKESAKSIGPKQLYSSLLFYTLYQRFSTGGTRTTGGTPDVAKWYAKK